MLKRDRRLAGLLAIATMAASSLPAVASTNKPTHQHTSTYAGQENRAIKSLSEEDIAQLQRGAGWGLAKAAELNGVPGPAHLLEMQKDITLTPEQIAALQRLFDEMNEKARLQGATLIDLERELETHFRSGNITDAILKDSLHRIAEARESLRYIHLSAHLKTPAILTKQQIALYNTLRGYAKDDPCSSVPKGHDPAMWKKHNGCQ
ncbi:hypothetical protein [Cohaesibacter intestini]|uniref:hypothetical protein n=1 Tax=Cohaesibacter intestini TaxID=2211145 RepID=UPI0018E55629|nr:hypothetical protein [Cohaesibacter intestini]